MDQAYYTYHIRIANSETVQVTKSDPNGKDLGQPMGNFRYKGKSKIRIQELHQAARKGELADTNVQELGERLFNALFDDVLKRDFFSLYEQVHSDDEALLRLELDVDESQLPEVAALPWEFMCVRSSADYGTVWLGIDPNIIFSRRRALWKVPKPIRLKEGERLRIALVVAAPDKLGPVKYEKIWEELQNLASEQSAYIDLLGLVHSATSLEIDKVLRRKPHIFHFIGHAELKHEHQRDIAQISLADDTSSEEPNWIGAERFSELFTRHRPGVVLLQACEGGMLSASEAFVGVASYVVQQNIPVVVAMQYEVSNATAQQFALEFYRCLAHDHPVDKAAQEGRRCIYLRSVGLSKRDFATPVLFMRVKDGQLFLLPSSPPEVEGENPTADLIEIKQALLKTYNLFAKGGTIYRDECNPAMVYLNKLSKLVNKPSTILSSLQQQPKDIGTRSYLIKSNLTHINDQVSRLIPKLNGFRELCPPSSNKMREQQYQVDRAAISDELDLLLENLESLLESLTQGNSA